MFALKLQNSKKYPWGWILFFCAPILIFYCTFIIYPTGATLFNSFHTIQYKFTIEGRKMVATFVGFKNFIDLFSDDIFLIALKNNAIWGAVGPVIEMSFATTLAFIVYFKVPFHRFYRYAFFTPMLVSGVIIGLIFRWVFDSDWGLVNALLKWVLGEGAEVNWLGQRSTSLGIVIFVHAWHSFGYSFILILAGLTTVDPSIVESAIIDGANKFKLSTKILLPMIMPVFITTAMLCFMGKMRAFHVVWVLTKGGPLNSSETIATYVQKRAFFWNTFDLGYPSAIAVFWFLIVMIAIIFFNRWLKRHSEI